MNNYHFQEKAIGKKIQLVPKKLTKILYSQGEGSHPSNGDAVQAFYTVYQISGKQIDKRENTPQQFIIGIGRLIEGMQIGLKSCRQGQKFTLIITPDYGYRNLKVNQEHSFMKNTLFVELTIIKIYKPDLLNLNEADSLIILHKKYQQVNQLLAKNKIKDAILLMQQYCNKSLKSKGKACQEIRLLFIQKYVNFLIQSQKYELALEINKKSNEVYYENESYFYYNAEIYWRMGDIQNSQKSITRYYEVYGQYDGVKKRKYIEFMKKINKHQELTSLKGYKYATDSISAISEKQVYFPKNQYFGDYGYNWRFPFI